MKLPLLKLERVKKPYKPGECIGCYFLEHSHMCCGGEYNGKIYGDCVNEEYTLDKPYLRYRHWYVVELNKNVKVI